MAIIGEPQRSQLYTKVRHLLGAPQRSVELEDEQMDTLLEFSIDEYSQYVQDWLIGCGFMKPQEGKYPYYPNKKVEYCTEGKY